MRTKDRWDKVEAYAKMIAAVSAAIGAIWIPWAINSQTEQNRNSQNYMQIMTEREKSDTEIRARMFERLLVNYLGEFKDYANKDDEQSFRKQIMTYSGRWTCMCRTSVGPTRPSGCR